MCGGFFCVFKDQSGNDLASLPMRSVNPSRRRQSHSMMREIDERVAVLPEVEGIRVVGSIFIVTTLFTVSGRSRACDSLCATHFVIVAN